VISDGETIIWAAAENPNKMKTAGNKIRSIQFFITDWGFQVRRIMV
jgi:hypothetical protein